MKQIAMHGHGGQGQEEREWGKPSAKRAHGKISAPKHFAGDDLVGLPVLDDGWSGKHTSTLWANTALLSRKDSETGRKGKTGMGEAKV